MVAKKCSPFPLSADWPMYLFLECSQVRYGYGKVCGPKASVTSVVKKNWLRPVCLRLCDTRTVCPRRSSKKWSTKLCWFFAWSLQFVFKRTSQSGLKTWSKKKKNVANNGPTRINNMVKQRSREWSSLWSTSVPIRHRKMVKNGRLFLASLKMVVAVVKNWTNDYRVSVCLWSPCLSVSACACRRLSLSVFICVPAQTHTPETLRRGKGKHFVATMSGGHITVLQSSHFSSLRILALIHD